MTELSAADGMAMALEAADSRAIKAGGWMSMLVAMACSGCAGREKRSRFYPFFDLSC